MRRVHDGTASCSLSSPASVAPSALTSPPSSALVPASFPFCFSASWNGWLEHVLLRKMRSVRLILGGRDRPSVSSARFLATVQSRSSPCAEGPSRTPIRAPDASTKAAGYDRWDGHASGHGSPDRPGRLARSSFEACEPAAVLVLAPALGPVLVPSAFASASAFGAALAPAPVLAPGSFGLELEDPF